MGKRYVVEPTRNSPYVCLDFSKGTFDLKGRSSPENTLGFYQRVFKAIAYYGKIGNLQPFTANINLVYFNTSSARCLFLIIKEIKKLQRAGYDVVVNWYAEEDDEDMVETGLDFQDIVDIDFNIIMIGAD